MVLVWRGGRTAEENIPKSKRLELWIFSPKICRHFTFASLKCRQIQVSIEKLGMGEEK